MVHDIDRLLKAAAVAIVITLVGALAIGVLP